MRRVAAVLLLLAACSGDESAAPGADAGSAQTCREAFGGAPVYMPCGEDADTCSFYTRGAIATCETICADLGAGCAASYGADDSCGRTSGDQNCVVPNYEQICICSRP